MEHIFSTAALAALCLSISAALNAAEAWPKAKLNIFILATIYIGNRPALRASDHRKISNVAEFSNLLWYA